MNDIDRDEVFRKVQNYFIANYDGPRSMQACLYWAAATQKVLRDAGRDAMLQAGSARFRMVPEGQDDGVSPCYYSYEWDMESALTKDCVNRNQMPEMHVWVADAESRQIIDYTTVFLPSLVREIGAAWEMPYKPVSFWGDCDACVAKSYSYEPTLEATLLAEVMLYIEPLGEPKREVVALGPVWRQALKQHLDALKRQAASKRRTLRRRKKS